MASFIEIRGKEKIREVLRAFLFTPRERKCAFIAGIHLERGVQWNGQVCLGGLVVEGARPMACTRDIAAGEEFYSLTNSDSDYRSPVGAVKLSQITMLELLEPETLYVEPQAAPRQGFDDAVSP